MPQALAQAPPSRPPSASDQEASRPAANPRPMIWHDQIIDWMLLHPDRTQGDCARHFNCSQSWLSIILNSHNFRTRYAQRRAELNQHISATTTERLRGLSDLSLETLTERIAAERESLPLAEIRDTAEMALRAMGYSGAAPSGQQPPQLHLHIGKEDLANARALMRSSALDAPLAAPEASPASSDNEAPSTAGAPPADSSSADPSS